MGLSLPKSNLIFLKKCLDKWVHFTPCCLVGWSKAYKLFVFWQSHDGILFIVLCFLWCCVMLSLLSALEVCEVPGHRGDIPRVVYISVEGACGV